MVGGPKTAEKPLLERLAGYACQPQVSPRRTRTSESIVSGPATPLRIPTSVSSTTPRKRRKIDPDSEYDDSPVRTHGQSQSGSRTPQKSPKRSETPSKRNPRPFASPEVYAHLNPVTDHLKPNLKFVFCGINPGKMSSTSGHHFAHPTNKFWKSLHLSGITDRQVPPAEDASMPDLYNFGLTNLCDRPTSEQSELSPLEMKLNVYKLTVKIRQFQPHVVCFVGKKIWDIYESVVCKTAGPLVEVPLSNVADTVKVEPGDEDSSESLVKVEEDLDSRDCGGWTVSMVGLDNLGQVKLEAPESSIPDMVPYRPSTPDTPTRNKGKSKQPMDWTKPRPFRLPTERGYTYFWVTPNTSGLERTPLAEQIVIFSHLRRFADSLELDNEGGIYRDIDVAGVADTVEAIRLAAEKKGGGQTK